MSSSYGNTPNPWASTYDTYSDCSQGLCSVYCPQWCYLVLPPPPPFFGLDTGPTSSSSPDFSPLIIVLIGILASAFLLVSYYTLVSKHCRGGAPDDTGAANQNDTNRNDDVESEPHSQQQQGADSEGLEEGLIKSIKVYRYKKSEGVVDVADCSVCLSEFEENDGLRMLPKCNHAFHVPCIDTWLKSHSSCPLCRCNIAAASLVLAQRAVRSAEEAAVVVVVEGSSEQVEVVSASVPKSPMIIPDRLLVADILLRQDDDDDDDDVDVVAGHHHHMESGMSCWYGDDDNNNNNNNIGTSSGTLGLMMRSPLASSRSISNGTFAFTNYGK